MGRFSPEVILVRTEQSKVHTTKGDILPVRSELGELISFDYMAFFAPLLPAFSQPDESQTNEWLIKKMIILWWEVLGPVYTDCPMSRCPIQLLSRSRLTKKIARK